MISSTLIQYVMMAVIRDKLIIGLCLLLVMAVVLSLFMGTAAVSEQDQFSAVFAAGSIRLLNICGLVLFIVFFIRRSFDGRDIEFLLSRPVGRTELILSFSAGFSLVAMVLGALSGVCVIALSPHLFSQGHVLWTLSMMVENVIMVNVALFFSMVLTSAASGAFACCGFYILARMMSQILGILYSEKGVVSSETLSGVMEGVSMLMPRLDLMTQTSWLIYGAEGQIGFTFLLAQGAIYSGLVLCAACIDLRLRQF